VAGARLAESAHLAKTPCGDAYWLDEDLPHVRRRQQAAATS
jgi:hypothetical protein